MKATLALFVRGGHGHLRTYGLGVGVFAMQADRKRAVLRPDFPPTIAVQTEAASVWRNSNIEPTITVQIENLTFTGNSGPFKIWKAGSDDVIVTVKSSEFSENSGETNFVSDLYLWGVDSVDIQDTTFRDSTSNDAAEGSLVLHDTHAALQNLTFQNTANVNAGGLSLIGEYDKTVEVTIAGLVCEGTVMPHGGCLFAENLQFLQVNNLEATGTRARATGGAVSLNGTAARFEAGTIRDSQAVTGGAVFQDGANVSLSDLRICQPQGDGAGAAL